MSGHIPAGILLAVICTMFTATPYAHATHPSFPDGTVNPVIGDRSFIARFGHKPDATTDHGLRVQTHLAYVERLLRAVPVGDIPPALRAERLRNLDRLHEYWMRGIFPQHSLAECRPCFIDDRGTICAVGYLVECSAGRSAAETINRQFKYATIADMRSALLGRWIAGSGLTRREVAMIQPAYPVKTGSVRVGLGGGTMLPIAVSYSSPLIGGTDSQIENAGSPLPGYFGGLSIQYKHIARRWPFSLLLNARYEDRSMSLAAPGVSHLAVGSDGTILLAPTLYHADIRYRTTNIGLLVMMGFDRSQLEVGVGSSIAKVIKSGRDEKLTLAALPTSLHFLEDPVLEYAGNRRELHSNQNKLGSGSLYQYSLIAGARFPIPFLKDDLMLTPSIWYDFGLTPVLYGTNWRSNALQLGVELQLEVLELIDYQ